MTGNDDKWDALITAANTLQLAGHKTLAQVVADAHGEIWARSASVTPNVLATKADNGNSALQKTPRTDAAVFFYEHGNPQTGVVPANFARQLERDAEHFFRLSGKYLRELAERAQFATQPINGGMPHGEHPQGLNKSVGDAHKAGHAAPPSAPSAIGPMGGNLGPHVTGAAPHVPNGEVVALGGQHAVHPTDERSLPTTPRSSIGACEVVHDGPSRPMLQFRGRIFRVQELGAEGKQWGNPADEDELLPTMASLLSAPSATRPRFLVRAGGDNYETWLCTTDEDVRTAFIEALYGSVETAQQENTGDIAAHMEWFKDPETWNNSGWLSIRQNYEDGWLEVIDLGSKPYARRRTDGSASATPDGGAKV